MTARVLLVRHGRATAGWDADPDPGLHPVGREQAAALASELAPRGPLAIVASPLRRTRETAAPLARTWGVEPVVDDGVGEVPSPTDDLARRGAWLRDLLPRRWSEVDPALRRWRDRVLDTVLSLDVDTVVVTHFVAINVVLAAATGDDRIVVASPGHCSCTEVDHDGRTVRLVAMGHEAATEVR